MVDCTLSIHKVLNAVPSTEIKQKEPGYNYSLLATARWPTWKLLEQGYKHIGFSRGVFSQVRSLQKKGGEFEQ